METSLYYNISSLVVVVVVVVVAITTADTMNESQVAYTDICCALRYRYGFGFYQRLRGTSH